VTGGVGRGGRRGLGDLVEQYGRRIVGVTPPGSARLV